MEHRSQVFCIKLKVISFVKNAMYLMVTSNIIPHRLSLLFTLLLYGKKVSNSLGRKSQVVKNSFILVQPNSKISTHSSPTVFSGSLASPTAS